jgi:hypothetical protein
MATTASSSFVLSRPVMTTSAPSATNNLAVANAIPDVAPVITATLPSSLGMVTVAFLSAARPIGVRGRQVDAGRKEPAG